MAKKKQTFAKNDEQLQEVNEALTGAGKWIEKNAKRISWGVAIIALAILAYIAYNQYVVKPTKLEASNENAKAVVYFMNGDFDKALNGDDAECIGFKAIADEYGRYQEGKLAALYTGVIYFEKGEYETAAEYLSKFEADDLTFDPAASQLLGDTYVELQDYDNAIKAYKAAANSKSQLIAPMSLKKLGILYLTQEQKEEAKKAFETIKNDYPTSSEAQDIDKYIAVAE